MPAHTVTKMVLIVCTAAAVVVFVASYLLASSISIRINAVSKAMENLQLGRFDRIPNVRGYDEISMLMHSYNQTCEKIEKLIADVETANREKNEERIKALQAQINPHFLYNSLATVIRLTEAGRLNEVNSMIRALVRFYRMSLNRTGEPVTIREEIEFVQEYMKICSIRFGDYASTECNVDESIEDCKILPMTVQPFVENVFKHALFDDGRIVHVEVNVYDAEDEIHIFVIDDGVGIEEETMRSLLNEPPRNKAGFGVYNVQKRLQLTYGPNYGVQIRHGEGKGTEVKVVIPKTR